MVDGRFGGFGLDLQGMVLPWRCLCCGVAAPKGLDLCERCLAALPWNGLACPHCALPLAAPAPSCAECLRDPPPFVRLLAPWRYAFPIDRLIVGLKYGDRLEHGRLLGGLFARWLTRVAPGLGAGLPLLPMPLHRDRSAARGFNQAAELARVVAPAIGARVTPGLARRTRATPAQARLDAAARRRNLAGAFAVSAHPTGCAASVHPQGCMPRRILLLDDVVTTGATVRELGATLRAAGCEELVVLALARVAD